MTISVTATLAIIQPRTGVVDKALEILLRWTVTKKKNKEQLKMKKSRA